MQGNASILACAQPDSVAGPSASKIRLATVQRKLVIPQSAHARHVLNLKCKFAVSLSVIMLHKELQELIPKTGNYFGNL